MYPKPCKWLVNSFGFTNFNIDIHMYLVSLPALWPQQVNNSTATKTGS